MCTQVQVVGIVHVCVQYMYVYTQQNLYILKVIHYM